MRPQHNHSDVFQQLTFGELGSYVSELEQALENHTQWLAEVNRTLICRLPPSVNDIGEAPDHLCKFGHWFHGIDNPVLTSLDSYARIDAIHKAMHQSARELLLLSQQGDNFPSDTYDKLINQTKELRDGIRLLLNDLNHNCDLMARLMTKVFENAREGVVIARPDSTIISVNKAFTKVTGYTMEEVIGKTPAVLRSDRQETSFYQAMWQELQEYGQWQGEIWNRNKQGEDYLEWLSISEVRNDDGELSHYVGIFSDITSIKENEAKLQYLAHYDQLTGLPNRILFIDRLKQAIAQGKRAHQQVAVMFLDLDGFKAVNDTLGHTAGDEMLRQVAKRLTQCLRATDTVARFGGDEFTVVLAAVDDLGDIIKVANKIISEVALPYDLDGNEALVTTSIGISTYPQHGEEPEILIHRADNAMYHAKRHGKNHHEFFGE